MRKRDAEQSYCTINTRIRGAERRVCCRVWETLQEFQENLPSSCDRDLIDRLEVLLRENIAYSWEDSVN